MSADSKPLDSALCKRCEVRKIRPSTKAIPVAVENYIRESAFEALCANCAEEIEIQIAKANEYPIPEYQGKLIEGIHYYMEGQLLVMTESYLLARGFCCTSGCRHCPYGRSV